MGYSDVTLTCSDCKEQFAFTAAEQEYYANKGFEYRPVRCPKCRTTYFERRREAGHRSGWVRRVS